MTSRGLSTSWRLFLDRVEITSFFSHLGFSSWRVWQLRYEQWNAYHGMSITAVGSFASRHRLLFVLTVISSGEDSEDAPLSHPVS